MTALYYAAKYGHLHIVKLLVDEGAHLRQMDVDGLATFNHARRAWKLAVAKWLFTIGHADLEINVDGLTALHIIAEEGDIAFVQWLVEESRV